MGTAYGSILSEDKKRELKNKLKNTRPHCYFCGSPYVSIIKGEEGPASVSCLICGRKFFVEHEYGDVL